MLQDLFHDQQEQIGINDISSPISGQIFYFCDPELFSDTQQNSEVPSSSNCCYDDNSSYTANPKTLASDIDKFNTSYQDNNASNTSTATTPSTTTTTTTSTNTSSTASTTAATPNNNNSRNLSTIFDSQEEIDNDTSASIDFFPSPPFSFPPFLSNQQYQFDCSSVQPNQIPISDVFVDGLSISQYPVEPFLGPPPLPSVFKEDCLSSVPSCVPLNPSSPSCSFLGPAMSTYMPAESMSITLSADSSGIFAGSILQGSELQLQDLDFQGANGGIFCPDSLQRVFNTGDLQKALIGESQQLVGGTDSSTTPIASEISSLEDSIFNVGKLSVEQRKEKIHRYMKKRNERNFSKKIKYACRKTLADSRPRVRGRFVKNNDFGETTRTTSSNLEEDEDDELTIKEEDLVDSSDIFAHISGVNSFKCNCPIQSWI